MNLWKDQIPKLSTPGLIMLVKDTEMRIGSHVAGGNPCDEYVAKQQSLLILIQEELSTRT